MSNILMLTSPVDVGEVKKGNVVKSTIKAGKEIDLDKDKRLNEKDVGRIIKSGAGYMLNEKTKAENNKPTELSAVRLVDYIQAIDVLDPDNEDEYTESGKPEVNALKHLIKGDVTAAERDMAFNYYQKLPKSNQSTELSAARLVDYIQAIDSLDSGNKASFTESGKPEVGALASLLGGVTETELDEVWSYYQSLSTTE